MIAARAEARIEDLISAPALSQDFPVQDFLVWIYNFRAYSSPSRVSLRKHCRHVNSGTTQIPYKLFCESWLRDVGPETFSTHLGSGLKDAYLYSQIE